MQLSPESEAIQMQEESIYWAPAMPVEEAARRRLDEGAEHWTKKRKQLEDIKMRLLFISEFW